MEIKLLADKGYKTLIMKQIFVLAVLLGVSEQTVKKFYNLTTTLPEIGKNQIHDCINEGRRQGVQEEDIWQVQLACLSDYYSRLKENDLDENDNKPFKEAEESGFGFHPPPSGFRTRREVRTLTDEEWRKTASVFAEMYKRGILRAFGRLHGKVGLSAHHGAAFLFWHRVFLTHFEEEMRKIDPTVSLPYWDYTTDFYIPKPTDSVVWTDCFFGDSSGVVSTEFFKNFYGAHYSFISRNADKDNYGKLISHRDIANLMKHCSIVDVTTGRQSLDQFLNSSHNLELLHDEVHDWVGGDMGIVQNSAYDPIFYMHHAYIDFIYEEFRQHQLKSCNSINLETEYRQVGDMCLDCNQSFTRGQGPDDLMYGYPHIRNKDGMWLNWTTAFYNYSPRPSCPDNCNGKYLYCNTSLPEFPNGVCVSKSRSSCTIQSRNRRNADIKPLEPKVPCSAQGKKFNVLKGDGRNRRMSKKVAWKTLQDYLGTSSEDEIAATKEVECKSNATGTVFGVLFGLETLGILLYCIVKYKRENGSTYTW